MSSCAYFEQQTKPAQIAKEADPSSNSISNNHDSMPSQVGVNGNGMTPSQVIVMKYFHIYYLELIYSALLPRNYDWLHSCIYFCCGTVARCVGMYE